MQTLHTTSRPTSDLYREDREQYMEALNSISPDAKKRWEENKNAYYAECKHVIDYAVYYYGARTPMGADEIRARANLIFCIACLRWDPNGGASLPTYVARQLLRLSGTSIRVESKHRNNFSHDRSSDGEGTVDILTLIGKPDERDTLREYIEKAGKDAVALYDACIGGWYGRQSHTGSRRPITPRGLFFAHVLPWSCKERYAAALEGIKAAATAWRTGTDFKGHAVLTKEA